MLGCKILPNAIFQNFSGFKNLIKNLMMKGGILSSHDKNINSLG